MLAPAVKKLKKVAVELLDTLKAEKLKIDHWRDKEATRDAVRVTIWNFLLNEDTGLPVDSYSDDEVKLKSEAVFQHVYWAYPIGALSPVCLGWYFLKMAGD